MTPTMTERHSPNHDARAGGRAADMLLLHYTGMPTAQEALDWLCDPASKVSAHYLVHESGEIVRLVDEERRAWHAGVACWAGETDINSCSVGIEIVNPGHEFGYRDFPEPQMLAVEALAFDIVTRHPIPPERVLGHSDVAPARKQDPGERFDWARLAEKGIGHWAEPTLLAESSTLKLGDAGDTVAALQIALADYGYGLDATGDYDEATAAVVTAFQRHFRQAQVDGEADTSTVETLRRLRESLAASG